MKIKTKKQLNLPQLIEWAWENDVRDTFAELKSEYPTKQGIIIDNGGRLHLVGMDYLSKKNTFTVEFEEEITEDTVIPKLMTTFKKTCLEGGIGYQRVRIDDNYPIKLMLNKAEAHREPVETLHIVNEDGTHTLIWHKGKLVE